MALSIPPGIFDSTVDLMAMNLSEVGASVGELLELGGLDGMELQSRETTWLCCLWKTIARGVPTARKVPRKLGRRETTWVGGLLEVGGLDGSGLRKMTARGVPTARTIVITKPVSLTAGFFKKKIRDSIISSCLSC